MTVEPITILMAEDDVQDQMLVKKAFQKARAINGLVFVNNGEELLQYLRREGPFATARRPDIILLDLNMPRMDGREALKEIKSDPDLCSIPVIVLTTSAADAEILRSYKLGASSYVQKPVTFEKKACLRSSWRCSTRTGSQDSEHTTGL